LPTPSGGSESPDAPGTAVHGVRVGRCRPSLYSGKILPGLRRKSAQGVACQGNEQRHEENKQDNVGQGRAAPFPALELVGQPDAGEEEAEEAEVEVEMKKSETPRDVEEEGEPNDDELLKREMVVPERRRRQYGTLPVVLFIGGLLSKWEARGKRQTGLPGPTSATYRCQKWRMRTSRPATLHKDSSLLERLRFFYAGDGAFRINPL
jgi:hypothetical protein